MGEAWATWWSVLQINLGERLVYRGNFFLGTLMRFLPILTQIFLWTAIFATVGQASGESKVAGYTYENVVAYYLLTMLSRAFSSMPGLASGVAEQIREGEIKKYLIQPIDMLGFLLTARVAHKLAYYVVAAAPFALVFFLCRGYFTTAPVGWAWLGFVASLLMAFLLGYFIEVCIGLIGFWFLEVRSLIFVYMLLSFFLSGHMFPIDMLANEDSQVGMALYNLVAFLPFKYLAYYPSAIFLGQIAGWDLVWGLAAEFTWLLFFIGLSRVMWHFGVRQYSAFGG